MLQSRPPEGCVSLAPSYYVFIFKIYFLNNLFHLKSGKCLIGKLPANYPFIEWEHY